MPDRSFILICRPNGFSIAARDSLIDLALPADVPPEEVAGAVSSALRSAGYSGGSIAIGLPAAWCMAASISVADLPRNDTKAMLYRLEENLPLAAESVIADFAVGTAGQSALGVCVRIDQIAPLVHALESAGVPVQSIFATAIAAAQQISNNILQSPCLMLLAEPGESQVNVIVLRDCQPTHWALVPATVADIKLQLDLLSAELDSIPHIEAIDLETQLAESLIETTSQIITVRDRAGTAAVTQFASRVLAGHVKPWLEFRRDALAIADPIRLYRKWVDLSLVAGIALLVALTAVFLFRANRYSHVEQTSTAEMTAAFTEHFPGWDIPVNVRAVVDAQYRKTTGSLDPSASGLARGSALTTLHDVLIPMLSQDHFQIERMAFHDHSFEISGRLQSYEQVDALSKVARSAGMVVTPAQTRRDADGTWTFTIQGSRSERTANEVSP
jgi:hypothetical protein